MDFLISDSKFQKNNETLETVETLGKRMECMRKVSKRVNESDDRSDDRNTR